VFSVGYQTSNAQFTSKEESNWEETTLPTIPLKHTTFLKGDAGEPNLKGMATHPPLKVLKEVDWHQILINNFIEWLLILRLMCLRKS